MLVIGGSQGARILNHTMPVVAGLLGERGYNLASGRQRSESDTKLRYQNELSKIQLNLSIKLLNLLMI